MKVLIPIDIVHPVEPTIAEMAKFLPLAQSEILFLYVKEELPSYERLVGTVGNFKEDWIHQVEKQAKTAFDAVIAQAKPYCAKVSTEMVEGPPAVMIESIARDEGFDVTVVTPGKHSTVEMFLMGSVSSNVVKHNPGTVVICRPKTPQSDKLNHVLMGIDGSEQSKNAIRRAAQQFKLNGKTQVTLVHVVSVADVLKLVSPVEYITLVENNLLMEGETFLADGKKILAENGITQVSCVLKEGDPAAELMNIAKSLPADLVVIGAQGRTAVQHFLLGSVSHRIAMHAPCSTVVIKA